MKSRTIGVIMSSAYDRVKHTEDKVVAAISGNGCKITLSVLRNNDHYQIEQFKYTYGYWVREDLITGDKPPMFSDNPVDSLSRDGKTMVIYDRDLAVVKSDLHDGYLPKPGTMLKPIKTLVSYTGLVGATAYKQTTYEEDCDIVAVYRYSGNDWVRTQTIEVEGTIKDFNMSGDGNTLVINYTNAHYKEARLNIYTIPKDFRMYTQVSTRTVKHTEDDKELCESASLSHDGKTVAILCNEYIWTYRHNNGLITAVDQIFIPNALSVKLCRSGKRLMVYYTGRIEFYEQFYEDWVYIGKINIGINNELSAISNDLDVILIGKTILDDTTLIYRGRIWVLDFKSSYLNRFLARCGGLLRRVFKAVSSNVCILLNLNKH